MTAKIYHNPRCGKSRETLKLLEANGITAEVIEYLKTPPSYIELDNILIKLALEPRELMRKKETVYKELNWGNAELDRATLIDAMINNPILIERPIVIIADKVAIGRPPEAVLTILGTVR